MIIMYKIIGLNQIDLDKRDFQTAKRVFIFRSRSTSICATNPASVRKIVRNGIESNSQDVIIDRSIDRMGYVWGPDSSVFFSHGLYLLCPVERLHTHAHVDKRTSNVDVTRPYMASHREDHVWVSRYKLFRLKLPFSFLVSILLPFLFSDRLCVIFQ